MLAGDGDGTFGAPTILEAETPVRGSFYSALYADLNGEGIPDLIDDAEQGYLSVYLGTGHGGFATPVRMLLDSYGGPMATGRYVGDNALSVLALTTQGGDGVFYEPGWVVTYCQGIFREGCRETKHYACFYAGSDVTGQPAPTGTISFYDGTALLGATAVNGSLATSKLADGMHMIVARYSGDGHFNPNASNNILVQVSGSAIVTLTPASLSFIAPAGVVRYVGGPDHHDQKHRWHPGELCVLERLVEPIILTFQGRQTTCGVSLATGASCTVSVVFKPQAARTYAAAFIISGQCCWFSAGVLNLPERLQRH